MMNKTKQNPVQRLKKIVSQSGETWFAQTLGEKIEVQDDIELKLPTGNYGVPEVAFLPIKIGKEKSNRREFYRNETAFFNDQIDVFWGGRKIDELRVNFMLMAPYSNYFRGLLRLEAKDSPLEVDLKKTFMQKVPENQVDQQEQQLKDGYRKVITYLCSGDLEVASFDDCLTVLEILDYLDLNDEDGIVDTCLTWLGRAEHQSIDRIKKLSLTNADILKEIRKTSRISYTLACLDVRYLPYLPENMVNEALFVMGFTHSTGTNFKIPEKHDTPIVRQAALSHGYSPKGKEPYYISQLIDDLPAEFRTKSVYLSQIQCGNLRIFEIPESLMDEEYANVVIATFKNRWDPCRVILDYTYITCPEDYRFVVQNILLTDFGRFPATNDYVGILFEAINMCGIHAISQIGNQDCIQMLLDSDHELASPNTKFLLSNIEEVRKCLQNMFQYLCSIPVAERTKAQCHIAVEAHPPNIVYVPKCHLDEEIGLKFLEGGGIAEELPDILKVQSEKIREKLASIEYESADNSCESYDREQLKNMLKAFPDQLKRVNNTHLDETLCKMVVQRNDITYMKYVPTRFKTKEFCLWVAKHCEVPSSFYEYRDDGDVFPKEFHEDIRTILLHRGYLLIGDENRLSRDEYLIAAAANPGILFDVPKEILDRPLVWDVLKCRKLKLGNQMCDFINQRYAQLDYGDQENREKKDFIEDLIQLIEF